MTRRTRGLALVVLGVAVSACTAIAGLTDDYHLAGDGTTTEGGAGDGNVDKDGALPDGFVAGDGGGSDAPADQQVTGTFCDQNGGASDVTYCWDFEQATAGPLWGWSDQSTIAATLAVEDSIGMNGSHALHAYVPSAGDGGSTAYLRKQLGGPDTFNSFQMHELSFSFSIKKKGTLYVATLGAFGWGANIKYIGVAAYATAGDNGIDVADPPGALASPYQLAPVNEWHRAIITMTRASAGVYTSTVKVTISGTTGPTLTVDANRSGFAGSTQPTEVLVGAFFTSTPGTIETVIDDVLLKQTK